MEWTWTPYVEFKVWKAVALLVVVGVWAFWMGYNGRNVDGTPIDSSGPQEPPDSP